MKDLFKIKEEFKSAIVGFNGSGLALGKRSDLDKLALLAHINPSLAKYFEQLPSKEQIKQYQGEKFNEQTPVVEETKTTVTPQAAPVENTSSVETENQTEEHQ